MSKEGAVGKILNTFSGNGKCLTVSDIQKATGLKKVDGKVHTLWSKGHLLASDIRYVLTLENSGNNWKWSRRRQRRYILANGEEQVTLPVSYMKYDRRFGKNVEVTEQLTFKKYENTIKISRDKNSKVLKALSESDVALSSEQVAKLASLSKGEARTALTDMVKQGKIERRGYFDLKTGRETKFPFGWLYFAKEEQYEKRLQRHDLLKGVKQRMYKHVLTNSKVQRRITLAREFEEFPFNYNSKTVSEFMNEMMVVYKDVKRIELNGEVYYYADGILSQEEIDKQIEFWKRKDSDERSFSHFLGHAHEQFVQFSLDMMWNNKDLRISDYFWEFSVSNGEKRYNVYKARASDPRKQFEFDRILHCLLSPFTNNKITREIILVFECKYRGRLDPYHWYRFIYKLADTHEFGTEIETKDLTGQVVRVRIPKFNVTPVIVIPWSGKDDIEVSNSGRKINFAQMILSQGGIVIYTREFERYVQEKTGKKIDFKRLFKKWFTKGEEQEEFTKYLLEYLGFSIGGDRSEKN